MHAAWAAAANAWNNLYAVPFFDWSGGLHWHYHHLTAQLHTGIKWTSLGRPDAALQETSLQCKKLVASSSPIRAHLFVRQGLWAQSLTTSPLISLRKPRVGHGPDHWNRDRKGTSFRWRGLLMLGLSRLRYGWHGDHTLSSLLIVPCR